ncbi:MAG: 30S ribosomal protein S18 [bacterium]|nr:30S ribosomal protein S18 [bacterium]
MENAIKKAKQCYLCLNNINDLDYKDTQLLRRFINSYGKILSKKRTGVCTTHQRKLALAVKRARIMALLPFTGK